jgi:ssDNA-binding Zn-finger/Zn-ribbon topoisomerase 1
MLRALDKKVYTYYIVRHMPKGGAMAGEHGRCPNCGSDRVVKAGKYNRGQKGMEQRYLCKSCHRFTTKPIQQLELIKSRDLLR